MKYVISTKEFEKANITEPQIFAILLACSCGDKSISSIFDELFKSDVLRKNMFTNEIEVNPFFLKIVREILYKTDPTIPDVEELDERAVRLMNIYPRGKKDGTNVYWRGNKKEIREKLQKFFKLYGDKYSFDEIAEATERYVISFKNDYSFMRVLKYFIIKDERILNDEGKLVTNQVSDLATFIENSEQEDEIQDNWTSTLK